MHRIGLRRFILVVALFVPLLVSRPAPAYAFKMAAHYTLAEKVRDQLPDGVIKQSMAEFPSIVAWGSYGPDIAYGQWGVAYGAFSDTYTPWADEYHYNRVGTMARVMLQKALASGDHAQIAFAAGWLTHCVGDMWVHGMLVNPDAKASSGGSGVFFDDPPSRELHGELELAADPLIWVYKGGHQASEYARLGGFPARYQPMPADNVDNLVVSATAATYRGVTAYEPDYLDDITDSEFDGMTDFIYNGSIVGGVPGLYETVGEARGTIPAGSDRERRLFACFDRARDMASGLLIGAGRGDYHGFTDSWNLDMAVPGEDGYPFNELSYATVRVRTADDYGAGTDADVFFRMGTPGAQLEKEMDTARWGLPPFNESFPSDFECGITDDYHVYVRRDWYWWPNLTNSFGLRRSWSLLGDDWKPSNMWVLMNGQVAAQFTSIPWFDNDHLSWSTPVDMSAWAPPAPVASFTPKYNDLLGQSIVTFDVNPGSGSKIVRILRSEKDYAKSPYDVANDQVLVTDSWNSSFTETVPGGKTFYYTAWARNLKGVYEATGIKAPPLTTLPARLELIGQPVMSTTTPKIGETVRVTITVRNAGSDAGYWKQVTARFQHKRGEAWVWFPSPVKLAPGETTTLVGEITPSTTGPFRGTLWGKLLRFLYDVELPFGTPGSLAMTVSPTPPVYHRVAGSDRYLTAVALSKENFPAPVYPLDAVVIATGADFPDALCAGPLSIAAGGPLLLWNPKGANTATIAEIRRLEAKKVIFVGSETVVPGSAQEAISRETTCVKEFVRLGGVNRYDTSRRVAEHIKVLAGPRSKVVVAYGKNFPDALSVSPLASYNRWPILLTDTKTLAPEVSSAIATVGATGAIVVGSETAVSSAAYASIPVTEGAKVRLGGVDRYDTCRRIVDYQLSRDAYQVDRIAFCVGTKFPDALTAGPVMARATGLNLLTRPDYFPAPVFSLLADHREDVRDVRIVGSEASLPEPLVNTLKAALPN